MAATNYYTHNGIVIGESTGGVHTSYGPDALGSVVATYAAGAPQNAYLRAPYGTQIQKTGTAADPKFGWNGAWAYRNTGRNYAGFYVMMRHYDFLTGQWTTVDPLWPVETAFVYAHLNPTTRSDPSGQTTAGAQMQSRGKNNGQYLYGLAGTFHLPLLCEVPPAAYINIWVSFVLPNSTQTLVDAGVSYAAVHNNTPCSYGRMCWALIMKDAHSEIGPIELTGILGGSAVGFNLIQNSDRSIVFQSGSYPPLVKYFDAMPRAMRLSVGGQYFGPSIQLSTAGISVIGAYLDVGYGQNLPSPMTSVQDGMFAPYTSNPDLDVHWPATSVSPFETSFGQPETLCGQYLFPPFW